MRPGHKHAGLPERITGYKFNIIDAPCEHLWRQQEEFEDSRGSEAVASISHKAPALEAELQRKEVVLTGELWRAIATTHRGLVRNADLTPVQEISRNSMHPCMLYASPEMSASMHPCMLYASPEMFMH